MGALIGAAILAFATLHESISKHVGRRLSLIFAACLYGAVIIFLASPAFGTNAGGAISASVAFAAFFIILLRRHKQIRVRTVATVGGVGLVVALSSLWVLNSLLDSASSTPSHIGKAFDHLFAGRFKLIYDIIHRKIAMNLHLMGVSSWSKLLTAGLIVIVGLSLYSRSRHYQQWTRENPSVSSGLTSILFGAVTAFVMNDSGLVAAAMMIIYIAVPMLLMHLGYRSDSHSANSGSN